MSGAMSDSNWRTQAIAGGMILGLVCGLVFAIVLGTDSRLSAASGFSIGAVVGACVHPEIRPWARFAALAVLAGLLIFAWLD